MDPGQVRAVPEHSAHPKVDWKGLAIAALLPALAVVLALAIGAVLLLLLHADPGKAYAALLGGAFGTTSGLTQSVVKATPLLLVALGIIIAFRANVINIGADLGVISSTAFFWLVTMALFTTVITTPILTRLYPSPEAVGDWGDNGARSARSR